MEIAIIEIKNLFAVYFNGKLVNPEKQFLFADLTARDILEKIMEYAVEFQISPTIDNLEFFYLEFDEQFDTFDNADGLFPEALHEAIKLYELLE